MAPSQLSEKEGAQILLNLSATIPPPKKQKRKKKTRKKTSIADFRRWNTPRQTRLTKTKPWRTHTQGLAQIDKIIGKGLDDKGREYVFVLWKGFQIPSFTLRDCLNSKALKWLEKHEHELSDYIVSDGE